MKSLLAALALLSVSPVFINQALIAQETNSEEVGQSKKTYTSDGKEIQTVIAIGIGTSPQGAAQNAAENALTQVVGSFIDAETILTKKTEIRDGVVAKSKEISKKISDYSQGSIKSFEILNTSQNGSIYNVTARVDVRIDDFRAYIKELAYGSKKINTGLFSVIKTEEDNSQGKLDLLAKVINPVINGEVIDINIGNPERLTELSAFGCESDHVKSYGTPGLLCNQIYRTESYKVQSDSYSYPYKLLPSKAIAIPITFNLKREYLENAKNILDNISSDKKIILGDLYRTQEDFTNFNYLYDYTFSIIDSNKKEWIHYHLPNIRSLNIQREKDNQVNIFAAHYFESCKTHYPNMRISLLDKKNSPIYSREFSPCLNSPTSYKYTMKDIGDGENQIMLYYLGSPFSDTVDKSLNKSTYRRPSLQPFLVAPSTIYQESAIYDEKRLLLVMQLNDEYMNNVNEISIEYVQE